MHPGRQSCLRGVRVVNKDHGGKLRGTFHRWFVRCELFAPLFTSAAADDKTSQYCPGTIVQFGAVDAELFARIGKKHDLGPILELLAF